jgi:hypothetical protein
MIKKSLDTAYSNTMCTKLAIKTNARIQSQAFPKIYELLNFLNQKTIIFSLERYCRIDITKFIKDYD